jgi:hypothetical protein
VADTICSKCGAAMAADARFCPACGASAGDTAGDPAPAATLAQTASPSSDTTSLTRFGQIAKTVALLAFLLPWVTISCGVQQIASVSGVRLATGVVSVRNPMSGAVESHSGSANWAVLLAALAIVLALLVSFVRSGRAGAVPGLVLSAAAAAFSIYAVMIDIPQQVNAGLRQQQGASGMATGAGSTGDLGSSFTDSMAHMIRVDPAVGFWITLFALAAACVLDWMIHRRRTPPKPS